MKTFDWVMDRAKFEAAVAECGANATELQIKAAYVKRAGLVRGAGKDDWKKGIEAPAVNDDIPSGIPASKKSKK